MALVIQARAVLQQSDPVRRQLKGYQLSALRWARVIGWLFVVVFLSVVIVLVLPILGVLAALPGLARDYGSAAVWPAFLWGGVPSLAPLILFLIPGGFYGWVLRKRLRRLEQSCAANPPQQPGEPATCHVCGGPLAVQGPQAVVRCGYCHADNLVAPRALARATSRRELVLAAYASEVRSEAFDTTGIGLGGLFVLPILSVVAPLVAVVGWGIAFYYGVHTEGPLNHNVQLVFVKTKYGTCTARYYPSHASERRVVPSGESARPLPAGIQPFTVDALIGKDLMNIDDLFDGPATQVHVTRAYSSPLIGDSAYVVANDAAGEEHVIEASNQLCLPPAK